MGNGIPITADDAAALLYEVLDQHRKHPVMTEEGRAIARLGAEIALEGYGIGPIDDHRREYVRAMIAALQLIDEDFGPQLLAMLNAFAEGVHRAPALTAAS